MVLIGHKDQHIDQVANCMHLSPKIIGDHIIKVQRLGHLGFGIHIQVCLFIHHGFCMVIRCGITRIYILVGLYQINMKHLIGCHGHTMDITYGCDYIFEKCQNIGWRRNDICLKFKVL
jgi:hypothetical protein